MPDAPQQDRELLMKREDRGKRQLTAYDPEMAFEIVMLVSEGGLLLDICKRGSGYCHPATFRRWVAEHPELAKAYKTARELSAQALEEEALSEGRKLRETPGTGVDVRAAGLLLDQLRWSAARRDPGNFGDKSQVSVRVPVTINTVLDLGEGTVGGQSTPEHGNVYTIDAKVVEEVPFDEIEGQVVKKNPFNSGQFQPGVPQKKVLTPRIPMDAETPLERVQARKAQDNAKRLQRITSTKRRVKDAKEPTLPE